MTIKHVLCTTALIFLSSCGGGGSYSGAQPVGSLIAFTTVDQDGNSGINDEQIRTVVIKDASAWASLWVDHKKNYNPEPPLPTIDFSQKMVVGVFIGARPYGCYSVEIDKVYQTALQVVVEYREHVPGTGVICTANITFPSHIVSFALQTKPVMFVKTDTFVIK